jgi:hypothetical protein
MGICLLALVLKTNQCSGQENTNLRYKIIAVSDTLYVDSLTLVPNTLNLISSRTGESIDTSTYTVLPFNSLVVFKSKPDDDSIKISYRVFPFALSNKSFNKDYKAYAESRINNLVKPFSYQVGDAQNKLIDFGSLEYNGIFSRNISFGSNQDVVLNSVFNLQLSGMLSKDLEITAAITDNNIPIQPEGTTQQVQEFDKIFIQLKKDRNRLIMGDFDLFNGETHFLKFSKKYQGGYYTGDFLVKKFGTIKTGAAGGISRGKFARNTLRVNEGNQGPYKLVGTNGETFIIILANTEEVFVNGQKMERGADRDYVIDYNLGEVTFMPRRIITKDLRVNIEFEYSDRSYLRTAAFVNTELETKKVNVRFNLFSEQDSKGQNVQQDLNDKKKLFLTQIGDSISTALYPGGDSVAYDAARILYEKIDTLLPDGGIASIYVYSTDSTRAKYAVSFSQVGQGRGNYIASTSTANGRVFEWIAPDTLNGNLVLKGVYEPLIFLVTPKYEQIYTLATDLKINSNNLLTAEVAMSNKDINMFSKKNDNDNIGFSSHINYKSTIPVKADSSNNTTEKVNLEFNYEFVQNRFNFIERFRNIEFGRDWNLNNTLRYNEHLATAGATYIVNGLGSAGYRFKTFLQDTVYKGFENSVNGMFNKNNVGFMYNGSYLHSITNEITTDYIRPKAELSYSISKIKGWRIGTLFDHEINRIKNNNSDTLTSNSFMWQNYKVFFTSPDTLKNRYNIEFLMRYEHKPINQKFDKPFFAAQTVTFNGTITSFKNQTINYNLTYRHVTDKDSAELSNQPEHFYLGRVDYSFTAFKGVIRSTTLYEIGSGREQKTQLTYQRSPTNQGDYIWLGDLNGDNIKNINEFQVKYFTDTASYVRVFTVTPEFVAVNTNQFNQVLNINPAAVWKNKKDFRKVISMFSIFASVQITKKTYADKNKKAGSYFNPFPLEKESNQIVSTALVSRNSLYFNRLDPKYGAQFDFSYTRNRTLLTGGIENRELQSQGALFRLNVVKAVSLQTGYTNGHKSNQSDFYKNLRYRFTYNDALFDMSYQYKSALRISAKYEFSHKVNPTDTVGKQTAFSNKLTIDARFNQIAKSTIAASLAYASIAYNDKNLPNQQLEFAMLEGLQNGNNLVWNFTFERNLTNFIQLSISYDGRMTGFKKGDKESLKPVHTGRAELRAVF